MKYVMIGLLLSIGWALGDIIVGFVYNFIKRKTHSFKTYILKKTNNNTKPKVGFNKPYSGTTIGFAANLRDSNK
jgi:hypothetical protein